MRKVLLFIGLAILTSCSSVSFLNKNKFKNVGSVTIYASPIVLNHPNIIDTNTILKQKKDLESLITRRISGNQNGTFFAILIDSSRNSYIEASIISHSNDSLTFQVNQTSLSKVDTFQFYITYDLSILRTRNFNRTSNDSYNLSFRTLESDALRTFQISKSNNFVIQDNLLELMTGEIMNPDGNKAKFVALNDLHDVSESLTGLCLIFQPNMALLKLKCGDKAKSIQCPKGQKSWYKVIPKNYFVARDYICQVDCK